MARTHPLSTRTTVTLADIKPYQVAVSKDFDGFNDSIVSLYRSRGVDIRFCATSDARFNDFLMKENGLAFAVGIPALGQMYPDTELKLIAAEDAIAVPICLISMKNSKVPAYVALEHWIVNERVLRGSDAVKRFAAAAAATTRRPGGGH